MSARPKPRSQLRWHDMGGVMLQPAEPRVILASASFSRRTLLEAVGLRFEAVPAHVDEAEVKRAAQAESMSAADTALALAELKASRVSGRNPQALVIGADQILVCDGVWFDKPADRVAARVQLGELRGRSHTLATGVVCYYGSVRVWHHLAEPRLTMRRFSDAFLDAYLAAEGEAVTLTVGAYRLEGLGVHLFERVDGDHAAVLGLPLLPLLEFLRQHGVLIG
ncbi:MAG TPA: nucleoside triphosphate pyrophosphatase [Acetobacteraceae bacterium]|jgi:septum formation protein|nr:nucleoside triphosphate pyrophosphatase [Acetobacteraceae bacterium]